MLLRLLLVMLLLLIRDGRLLNLESDAKLPARAAWLTQGDIWWRLDLFFDEMKRDGSECRQYHKWYEFFEHQLKKTPLAENNSLGSHVYSPKGRVPNPDAVQEDLASFCGPGTVHVSSILHHEDRRPQRVVQNETE